MTRARLSGLFLIAVLVLGVVFAASAQAKKCECGGDALFEVKGGEARLATSKGTFRATHASGAMEFPSDTSGTATLIFEAVEAPGGLKCASAGQALGTVRTSLLSAELGWISKAKQEVGLVLRPASGGYSAEFECGGLAVKLKGSVIGHLSPVNVSVTEMRLSLFGSEGVTFRNEPPSFESGATHVLTTEFSTFPGAEQETVLQQSIDLHARGNASVCKIRKGVEKCKPGTREVSTIAYPGQPELGRCRKKGPGLKYTDSNCTTPGEKGKYGFAPVS